MQIFTRPFITSLHPSVSIHSCLKKNNFPNLVGIFIFSQIMTVNLFFYKINIPISFELKPLLSVSARIINMPFKMAKWFGSI